MNIVWRKQFVRTYAYWVMWQFATQKEIVSLQGAYKRFYEMIGKDLVQTIKLYSIGNTTKGYCAVIGESKLWVMDSDGPKLEYRNMTCYEKRSDMSDKQIEDFWKKYEQYKGRPSAAKIVQVNETEIYKMGGSSGSRVLIPRKNYKEQKTCWKIDISSGEVV